MVDIQKLKGKIVEKGKNVNDLSKELGVDKSTLYRKLKVNGETLTVREIVEIAKSLQLSKDDVMNIFFNGL